MPVPGLDGGQERCPVLESTLLDLAGAAAAIGRLLIAGPELRRCPAPVGPLQQVNAVVAGGQQIHALALRRDRMNVMHDMQTFVDRFRSPAVAYRVFRNAIGLQPYRSVQPVLLFGAVAAHERS